LVDGAGNFLIGAVFCLIEDSSYVLGSADAQMAVVNSRAGYVSVDATSLLGNALNIYAFVDIGADGRWVGATISRVAEVIRARITVAAKNAGIDGSEDARIRQRRCWVAGILSAGVIVVASNEGGVNAASALAFLVRARISVIADYGLSFARSRTCGRGRNTCVVAGVR